MIDGTNLNRPCAYEDAEVICLHYMMRWFLCWQDAMTLLPLSSPNKHKCLVYTVKAMSRVIMLAPFLTLNNIAIYEQVSSRWSRHSSMWLSMAVLVHLYISSS